MNLFMAHHDIYVPQQRALLYIVDKERSTNITYNYLFISVLRAVAMASIFIEYKRKAKGEKKGGRRLASNGMYLF